MLNRNDPSNLKKANQHYRNGQYEKAQAYFDKGISLNPDLSVISANKSVTASEQAEQKSIEALVARSARPDRAVPKTDPQPEQAQVAQP